MHIHWGMAGTQTYTQTQYFSLISNRPSISLSLYCTHTAAAPSHAHAFFRSLIFEQFGWPPASKVFSTHSPICKCKCNIYIYMIYTPCRRSTSFMIISCIGGLHSHKWLIQTLALSVCPLSVSLSRFFSLSLFLLFIHRSRRCRIIKNIKHIYKFTQDLHNTNIKCRRGICDYAEKYRWLNKPLLLVNSLSDCQRGTTTRARKHTASNTQRT